MSKGGSWGKELDEKEDWVAVKGGDTNLVEG